MRKVLYEPSDRLMLMDEPMLKPYFSMSAMAVVFYLSTAQSDESARLPNASGLWSVRRTEVVAKLTIYSTRR